jgi:hypothetical protein
MPRYHRTIRIRGAVRFAKRPIGVINNIGVIKTPYWCHQNALLVSSKRTIGVINIHLGL